MKLRALALILATLLPTVAAAQQYPVVPGNSVIGRNSSTSGPSQAIPFTTLGQNLYGTQAANKVLAGPASGVVQFPSFRLLVGADLPVPGASSLGGIESITSLAHNWIAYIDTSGVPHQSQPAFSDISGSFTSAQCVAATSGAIGCVKPDNSTITVSGGVLTAVSGTAASIDAGGATAVTNCGTTGAVLYNASGNVVGCAGGARILLATLTASNSATLSDTTHITSTYNEYDIVFENIVPATTSTTCEIQVHSGGSFQATSYLTSGYSNVNGGTLNGITSTTFIPCSLTTTAGNAAPGISGTITVYTPSASALHQWTGQFSFLSNTSSQEGHLNISGYWNSSAVIDGFQVLMSTGNLTSGKIKIYGRL